ncbi:hypothetical protein EDB87DRAFT_1257381 [Lactarius vividus]|nr:hypothetical protein EDB87DRAFT_1257381 [Lactarius vividus]
MIRDRSRPLAPEDSGWKRLSSSKPPLNHDVLLNIFHWYRLGNTTDSFGRGWNLERWWYRLIHVCRTWRHLILASPTGFDLHLVCTHGTPVTTMLTHSPPLPLIINYPGGSAGKEEDVHFLLQLRERVRRIHIGASAANLLSLLNLMDGEYPSLQHLVIYHHTNEPSASSTGMKLPAKLRAPLLRRLTLFDLHPPVGSELLRLAEGLVTLELIDIVDSLEAHPALLVMQIGRMAQLERLIVHFRRALPNRTVERTLVGVGATRVALPHLKHLSFRGGSAYLEGILARISAPILQALFFSSFAQLTFELPCLVRFVHAAQRQPLLIPSSTAYAEGDDDDARFQFKAAELHLDAETAYVLLDRHSTDPGQARMNPVQLRVSCRALDWQLAGLSQICRALTPLFARVEYLTLGLHISHPNLDWDLVHTQLHELLRSFGGTKTLQLAGPHTQHLWRWLQPRRVELLPTVQRVLGQNQEPLYPVPVPVSHLVSLPIPFPVPLLDPVLNPSSAPLPVPVPVPVPVLNPSSAPPLVQKRKNWFQKFMWDYSHGS